MERRDYIPNPFYEINITLISKPDKDITRKEKLYTDIASTDTNAKIPNKLLANEIQQHIKKILYLD